MSSDVEADSSDEAFERCRRHLMRVACRVLRSTGEAEDVMQEAWIRWHRHGGVEVLNHDAFFTTMVTRLALDRLRRNAARHEVLGGDRLARWPAPEAEPGADLEQQAAVSLALLRLRQTLSPLEEVAFLLKMVFALPYPQVAEVLRRSEPAARQLVHRARHRLEGGTHDTMSLGSSTKRPCATSRRSAAPVI